jgi:hypothetical protein
MAAITERLVTGVTTSAKRILLRRRMLLSVPVIEGIAFGIGDNPLLAERRAAGDEVGTILGYFDFCVRLFVLFHGS